MAMWRCSQCGTPQAEATRCWVCSRSAVSCSTCRNFRRSIAGQLGYCALDRARVPLKGDEVHACWQAPLSVTAPDDQGLFAMRSRALASADRARPSGAVVPRSAARVEPKREPGWTANGGSAAGMTPRPAGMGDAPDAEGRAAGRLVDAPLVRPSRGADAAAIFPERSAEAEGDRLPDDRPIV